MTTPAALGKLRTIQETAMDLHVSTDTVRRHIRRDRLGRTVVWAGRVHVRQEAIDAFIAAALDEGNGRGQGDERDKP